MSKCLLFTISLLSIGSRFERQIRLNRLCIGLIFFSLNAAGDCEKIFTKIYETFPWDDTGFSISGSQIEITGEYVVFLQNFIEKNDIRSVVDLGCGDWAFSRYINWKEVQYTGIDIVKMVVERNQKLFGTSSIEFIHGNILEMDLPEADLMVCKDVFQHLSNEDIMLVLKRLHKFKHCLITNFVDPFTLTSHNPSIPTGQLHYIDLSKPPFNLDGEKVLTFMALFPKQTFYIRGSSNPKIPIGRPR